MSEPTKCATGCITPSVCYDGYCNRIPATPLPAPDEPQYATIGELYNAIANELDETRTPEDAARLTAAMHALDERNPPPVEPATTAPSVMVTGGMVEALEAIARIHENGSDTTIARVQQAYDMRCVARHALTAALSARTGGTE